MRFRLFRILASTLSCCLLLAGSAFAAEQGALSSAATQAPVSHDGPDYKAYPSCPLCGMNREKFAHSRMLITYDDQTVFPACSLHCAALDMAVNLDKTPVKIEVGDYKTKNLIDAEKAVWVIGGDQAGVMSKRAKWAFADKAEAEAYVKAHGGQLTDFDGALKAAFEDLAADTMMIRDKRKMMRMHQQQQAKPQ